MRLVFVRRHGPVADLEHIRIVPMSHGGALRNVVLCQSWRLGLALFADAARHGRTEADAIQRLPTIVGVAGSAPAVSAHLRAPLPDFIVAVLAQAVQNRASALQQRVDRKTT